MQLSITFEFEDETQRWIAELDGVPGASPVLAYGKTKDEACRKVQAAAFWYISGKLEVGEMQQLPDVIFQIAA